jgi:pimeloyl-ACP methyl ester carboxylesterase
MDRKPFHGASNVSPRRAARRRQQSSDTASSAETIILIHGLASPRLMMSRLARQLSRQSYRVINWGYRSLWSSIEQHAQALQRELQQLEREPSTQKLHLVTHSMGSIIARRALELGRPDNLGYVVMLCPPNLGSHVARRLAAPLGWLCPPLRELSDASDSFVNRLPNPANLPVGIIAAAGDRMVAMPNTVLNDQLDWLLLPGQHSAVPFRGETAEQIVCFLRTGRFARPESSG